MNKFKFTVIISGRDDWGEFIEKHYIESENSDLTKLREEITKRFEGKIAFIFWGWVQEVG